jgi:hypothetical protein
MQCPENIGDFGGREWLIEGLWACGANEGRRRMFAHSKAWSAMPCCALVCGRSFGAVQFLELCAEPVGTLQFAG